MVEETIDARGGPTTASTGSAGWWIDPVVSEGDELGLEDGVLPAGVATDAIAVRNARELLDERTTLRPVPEPVAWTDDGGAVELPSDCTVVVTTR